MTFNLKGTNVFFQLMFEGEAGSSYTGDIAVDDVKLMDGTCPLPGKTVTHYLHKFASPLFFDSLVLSDIITKFRQELKKCRRRTVK